MNPYFKNFIKVVLPVFLFLGLIAFVLPVDAAEIRVDDVTVSEDEYIEDDLYLFGDEIKMEGIVTGDLVASGGTVTISGTVDGDLYVSGGEVVISGDVGRSVYCTGGNVKISGVISRSLYVAGGQISFTSDSYVGEDINVVGGQLDMDGYVGDDVRAAGGTLRFTGMIDDDLIASGGTVTADEDNVGGDYKISSGDTEGRQIGDTAKEVGLAKVSLRDRAMGLLTGFLWFGGMYLAGVVFIRFAPVKTWDIVGKMSKSWKEFLLSAGVGFLVSAALPVILVVLAVTVIGAPLAILLAGLLGLILVFGGLWADMSVGKCVFSLFGYTDKRLYAALFAGRVIRLIIRIIPCVGFIYSVVLFWAVAGAVVRMKMDRIGMGSVEGGKAAVAETTVKSGKQKKK